MKVLLAIPSYKRPYEIEKRAGYWLKQLQGIDWKIFIREEEYIYYSQVFSSDNLVEIKATNFRETINAIGEYALANGYELVHKVDDDMSFKKLGSAKKTDCAKVYTDLLKDVVKEFSENKDLYGVSVAKPMNHIRNKNTLFTRHNKALYGNYFLRPEIMNLPVGIELFDDIYFTLLILNTGKTTMTYTLAYEDAIILKNSGGLQSINRNEASKRTIVELQKIYPQVQQGCYKNDSTIVDIDLKALGIK